jgi:hypothetical protein
MKKKVGKYENECFGMRIKNLAECWLYHQLFSMTLGTSGRYIILLKFSFLICKFRQFRGKASIA